MNLGLIFDLLIHRIHISLQVLLPINAIDYKLVCNYPIFLLFSYEISRQKNQPQNAGMKIYYFSDTNWQQRLNLVQSELTDIFDLISDDTDTSDLVVSNYFLSKYSWSGGIAFARNWLSASQFISSRGRWKFTRGFDIPQDLPANFKLIRMHIGMRKLSYPLCQFDRYGWKLTYESLRDHIAFLFAHELHHFRRYHLGFHAREGENLANKWAIDRLQQLNFHVKGLKINQPRAKQSSSLRLIYQLIDPFKRYRSLSIGDKVLIKHDPKGRYHGQIVPVVLPVRSHSRRVVIETADGKQWRWPLEWIDLV